MRKLILHGLQAPSGKFCMICEEDAPAECITHKRNYCEGHQMKSCDLSDEPLCSGFLLSNQTNWSQFVLESVSLSSATAKKIFANVT